MPKGYVMRKQIWKVSIFSVAGMAAVANGGAGGPLGDGPSDLRGVQKSARPITHAPRAVAVKSDLPVAPVARLHRPGKSSSTNLTLQANGSRKAISPIAAPIASPRMTADSPASVALQPVAAFARQFAVPTPQYGSERTMAKFGPPENSGMLYSPDTAYVEQIGEAQARQHLDHVAVSARIIDDKSVGEISVGRFEKPDAPAYVEVIDDPKASGKLIVRPLANVIDPALYAASSHQFTDKNNDKSPVDHPPQTGGSAEFE